MRLEMTGSFDADGSAASSNDLLFLGFHGYSNDESGMVRIINAICATGSPDNTHHANANGNGNVNSNTNRNPAATHPSSPTTSHSAAHIRAHTSAATTGIPTDAPSASANMSAARSRRSGVHAAIAGIPAFPQGVDRFFTGRIPVVSHDYGVSDVFDMAVLLSPSFKGETAGHDLPAAHDSRFATAVMTVRFQSPTSSVPVSNLARPVVARISNIPAWRTTYVIRKLPTCAPGWDCEPWRVLTYHA